MRKILFLISFFIVTLFISPLYAVDPDTDIGERYLEEQRRQIEIEALERRQESYKESSGFSGVPEDATCFYVEEIVISGNSIFSYAVINRLVEKYRKKCLGKNAINQLMQELSGLYIDKGYITSRVYIPPQDLTLATLELIVVEGYVESVTITSNSLRSDDRRKLWWAMKPTWGKHLRLPEIEQAIDQINRVPSANAQMKLWPGQKIGSTNIQIENSIEDEFRGSLNISNDGQVDTGIIKTRIGMAADNWLGINDTVSLNLITSTNTNALTMNGSVPYRWWNFDSSYSYSEYLNILPENTDLFGQSHTGTFNGQYLFFRNSSTRMSIMSTLTIRRSERYVLGVKLTPQKLVPLRIAATYSRNSRWGYISGEIGHVQGTSFFGATLDERSAPKYSPLSQFKKQDIRLTIGAPLSSVLLLQTVIAAQYSDDALYSSEQIHLGDASSVRGSDSVFATGDRGFYIQNTVSTSGRRLQGVLGLQQNWLNGLNVRFFTDYGNVRQLSADRKNSGAGIGMGFSYHFSRLNVDFWWAKLVQAQEYDGGKNIFSANIGFKLF